MVLRPDPVHLGLPVGSIHVPGKPVSPADPWCVIILSKNAANLRRAAQSVYKAHPGLNSDRLIVVDDGASTDWLPTDPQVRWIPGVKPFVFARNVNIGIAIAQGDVIIMGDDCELLTPSGFDLLRSVSAHENIGIVSPGIAGPVGNPIQAARSGAPTAESTKELVFVTVYIPRRVINAVGLLDDRFVGYGLEDVDFSWRVMELKRKLVVDYRVAVRHNAPGMDSSWRTRPDFIDQWNMNKQIFRDKWKRAYP